jgi:hypothetical protein
MIAIVKRRCSSWLLKLKRPHGTEDDTHGEEGLKEVVFHGAGEWRNIAKGGNEEDRCDPTAVPRLTDISIQNRAYLAKRECHKVLKK